MAKPRILIIDDDRLLQDLQTQFLMAEGFEVRAAYNGRAGLQVLLEEPVDLVVVDLMMPVMDGLSFIPALAEQSSPPPVLVLSAAVTGQREQDLKAAGVQGVIRQPVEPEELARRIRATLAGSA